MNEAVYAWSDALNKRVLIGVNVFDGRDGLLPDRGEHRDTRWITAGDQTKFPSQREMGDAHNSGTAYLRKRCGCGRPMAKTSRRCGVCLRADRWVRGYKRKDAAA